MRAPTGHRSGLEGSGRFESRKPSWARSSGSQAVKTTRGRADASCKVGGTMRNNLVGHARSYPCESCGADLAYESGASELACSYCGFRVAIGQAENADIHERDLTAVLARVASQRAENRSADPEQLELCCRSCSAGVVFHGTLTALDCPYCGSPIQRADVHRAEDRIAVDAVLPFQISHAQARDAVRAWLRAIWLAPRSFTAKQVPERVQSVYLPYWTFDALTSSSYRGRKRVRYGKNTRWVKRTGSFPYVFDDLAVIADASLPADLTRPLEPWPMANAQPYQPEYLAGHLAKTYDVQLDEGFKRARNRMEQILEHEARKDIGGQARIDDLRTRWDALTYKHVLLPVFLLSIRHSGSVYRLIVNGVTGKVSGQRPWSPLKVTLAAAALLALLAAASFLRNGG